MKDIVVQYNLKAHIRVSAPYPICYYFDTCHTEEDLRWFYCWPKGILVDGLGRHVENLNTGVPPYRFALPHDAQPPYSNEPVVDEMLKENPADLGAPYYLPLPLDAYPYELEENTPIAEPGCWSSIFKKAQTKPRRDNPKSH
eukprot:TRINITY_DN8784_c0_g1_i2.p1 TRINITY_DN8784_c0_g1~~TRINITY_DN8784_c0_g1_i2.p1  ORF type:complete len:156 (+),score=4.25 TRINITY_DN8784_c0_g1_i2:44-469(+)